MMIIVHLYRCARLVILKCKKQAEYEVRAETTEYERHPQWLHHWLQRIVARAESLFLFPPGLAG